MRTKDLERITRSNFFIKLKSWEYWPFGILQLPLFIYFMWLALRARSLFFFSAANPGIVMGGMFGESKFDVLQKIPPAYKAQTIVITLPANLEQVIERLSAEGFSLPVIFKPDLGERGFMVKCISNAQDIDAYLKNVRADFLVQQLITLPLELGIFYTRYPSKPNGEVTSVVIKEMLAVTGDGHSTLAQLIQGKDRAKLQWQKLKDTFSDRLSEVIPQGVAIELVSIGNHALGTKFLDGSHLINAQLSATFDHISKQIDGFYFGRFDLRCASLEDLYAGRVKILELNGCGAEPAHIYAPGFGLLNALGVLFTHWADIFRISRENHRMGIAYTSFRQGRYYYRRFKALVG